MDAAPLRDHPHLPLLSMTQCLAVFNKAGITFNRLATLSGYSRMAVYLWRKGDRKPLSHALDRVSTLAYKALGCLRAKTLPVPPGLRESAVRLERTRAALDAINLTGTPAEDLLPASWLKKST
jgi:hypothetical protein